MIVTQNWLTNNFHVVASQQYLHSVFSKTDIIRPKKSFNSRMLLGRSHFGDRDFGVAVDSNIFMWKFAWVAFDAVIKFESLCEMNSWMFDGAALNFCNRKLCAICWNDFFCLSELHAQLFLRNFQFAEWIKYLAYVGIFFMSTFLTDRKTKLPCISINS